MIKMLKDRKLVIEVLIIEKSKEINDWKCWVKDRKLMMKVYKLKIGN